MSVTNWLSPFGFRYKLYCFMNGKRLFVFVRAKPLKKGVLVQDKYLSVILYLAGLIIETYKKVVHVTRIKRPICVYIYIFFFFEIHTKKNIENSRFVNF